MKLDTLDVAEQDSNSNFLDKATTVITADLC